MTQNGTIGLSLQAADMLAQATAQLNAGRPAEAVSILAKALALAPGHLDVLMAAGVAARRLGKTGEAIGHFEKALAMNPSFAPAWANLGAALLSADRHAEAAAALEKALAFAPFLAAAAYNLGNARTALGDFDAAIAALQRAASLGHPAGQVEEALGASMLKAQRFDEAIAAFRRAIAADPRRTGAYRGLAQAHEVLGQVEEAERILRQAVAANPVSAETYFALGALSLRQRRSNEAIDSLWAVVQLQPNHLLAHKLLNETLWQAGHGESYLASYPAAIFAKPNDRALRIDYGQQLLRTMRPAEALAEFDAALALDAQSPAALDGRAQALAALRQFDAANEAAAHAAKLAPRDPAILGRKGELLLRSQRFGEAVDALRHALQARPLDQENLARLSTAYRCAGEDRAHLAFADPDALAVVSQLEPPDGFRDIESFNRALAERLRSLHTAKQHPTDQTLRGGTQTLGSLFANPDPLVQQLKAQLERAISKVIAAMPDRSEHPFYQRKAQGFRFAGSWSVLLKTQGFHTNHIHPQGWISSAYYINLPDEVEGGGHEGWFKIGETNPDTMPLLPVERWVKPRSGSLVLFPSYMWHGTQAFARSAERLTVAFDVVPD